MPLSLTHKNTPKTPGLELVAWELPFMSVPTLKPWQGEAPEPAPTLCCHPTFPPPALFLNIASPSKSPLWRNEPKFNFGLTWITKQSVFLAPQPHQSALSGSHSWTCSDAEVGAGGGCCRCQNRRGVVPAITWSSSSCNVLATATVSSSTSKLPLCLQNHG